MNATLSRVVGVLATAVAMLYWISPTAYAEPEEPVPVPPSLVDAPTLSLADLGAATPLTFYGRGTTSLTVPVPDGLVPVALNATLQVPLSVRTLVVTVTQEDRTLARVELPPTDSAPVVIPLAGVKVVDHFATVSLTTTFAPVVGACLDPSDPVRLVDGSVTYSGIELPPTTVADFLPPVLRKLTIAMPPKPSQAESNAVARLATTVVAQYGAQNPEVSVVPLEPGASTPTVPSAPLERQIVVTEGPTAGLALKGGAGVPALTITGSGSDLTNQIQLLTQGLAPFALSPSAVAPALADPAALPGDTATLRELGQSELTAVWLTPQVTVRIDQTRFGHSIERVRLHLIGSYSPVPRDSGGQIVVLVGNETVDHWAADETGTIDRWVDIPDRLLGRYTNVVVKMNVTGDTGQCGDSQPATLTVDGDSQVVSSPAKPPVPQGFQSLPQTLTPRLQVGIGSDTYADTVRAVAILVGLQRLSSIPVEANVTSLRQATNSSDPAILIAAQGWTDKEITLPISAADGKVTIDGVDASGKPATITLGGPLTFGSLQTVFDGQRSVLVATSNGTPQQLDDLLGALNADRNAWAKLDGSAVISVPGRGPVVVPNPAVRAEKTSSPHGFSWQWWVAGGVVVLAALSAAVSLLISRRSSAAAAHREDPGPQ